MPLRRPPAIKFIFQAGERPLRISERHLQRQLHHAGRKADIGGRDLTECSRASRNASRAASNRPTGNVGVRKGEVRGVRYIVSLGAERQQVLFGECEVLENREVQASPLRTVALITTFIPWVADSLLLEGI